MVAQRLRIGLTGGIGSGKSTAAAVLSSHGAHVIDTDAIARQLTATGGSAIAAIAAAFGPEFIDASGALDRARMRALAFGDAGARSRLEHILHPLIGAEAALQARLSTSTTLVFDVPLLAESGHWRARVDRVLVIDCAETTQVDRVAIRPGWTRDAASAVVAQQATRAIRRSCADAVVFNDGLSLEQFGEQLRALWSHWHACGSRLRRVEQSLLQVYALALPGPPTLILYEYPFNESIRTMLRLEHLFDRLGQLVARDTPLDHHFALVTIFEVMDVASRADLKSDLLKELERQRAQLGEYRGNPSISEAALEAVVARVDHAFTGLNQLPGKAGAALTSNDWLMSIRSRISIPGGTCEFDLPAYFAWQKHPPQSRRADLMRWAASLMPLAEALSVLLSLLRDSGAPSKVVATGGHYQQSLPVGRAFHLLRVRLSEESALIPEISGHRLMVSVRLMRQDAEGRLRPNADDTAFELTLCS